MVIDFKKEKNSFDPIVIEGKELDIVNHAKILGVTVSNNLLWNNHINDVIRKANKRLYFIVLLKRARLPAEDIIRFYCTCIRPVLEYCAPVFHHSLSRITCDKTHKLYNLHQPENLPKYDFRYKRTFNVVRIKTMRYQKTFIPKMCSLFNNS